MGLSRIIAKRPINRPFCSSITKSYSLHFVRKQNNIGIFVLFTVNKNDVYRVDFFGDEIDSIRVFGDSNELDNLTVLSASDFIIKESEVEEITLKLKECYLKHSGQYTAKKATALYTKILDALNTDLQSDELTYLAPLVSSTTHDITKIFGTDFTVIYDESKMLEDNLNGLYKEHIDRAISLIKAGDGFDFSVEQYSTKDYILNLLNSSKVAAVQTLTASIPFFNPQKTYSLSVTAVAKYSINIEDLFYDAKAWLVNG